MRGGSTGGIDLWDYEGQEVWGQNRTETLGFWQSDHHKVESLGTETNGVLLGLVQKFRGFWEPQM